jgi:hypothetical protein
MAKMRTAHNNWAKTLATVFVSLLGLVTFPEGALAQDWREETKLLADDGREVDHLGRSVAISGGTALVGTYLADVAETDQGAVYVFREDRATWTQAARLVAEDASEGDFFGYSVALEGETALVGAYYGDKGDERDCGAAYVFRVVDGTWTQIAKLTGKDSEWDDIFGCSVALSGDTAMVGAWADDDRGSRSGSVYVFREENGDWVQVQKLTAEDGAPDDRFGVSVSLMGNTALVGADWDDDRGSDSGSVYVFEKLDGGWTQVAKLAAADGGALDGFGSSIALEGDKAIIGAAGDDSPQENSGSAYIFTRIDGNWTQTANLTARDGERMDYFGCSVALSRDTALIGAMWDDERGTDSGSAYVFRREGSRWSQLVELTPDGASQNDHFGYAVGLSDNMALIGASGDDERGDRAGAAYLFSGRCVRVPEWVCDGDVDGDGQVNPVDAGVVQSHFGSDQDVALCNYDLDCDGQINPVDSGIVQSLFGTCDAPRGVCP